MDTTANVSEELRIVVDYTRTLEEMIAAGRYERIDSEITPERFPVKGEGKEDLIARPLHLNIDLSSESVIAEMEKTGFRPGTIEELLAFGEQFPEVQRKFPVVALGSSANVYGDRNVACLDWDGSERRLDLAYWQNDWALYCRFLAFRK